MNTNPLKFWMVKGLGATVVAHPTRAQAAAECQRLARQHVGQSFFLLESTSVFAVNQLPVSERIL